MWCLIIVFLWVGSMVYSAFSPCKSRLLTMKPGYLPVHESSLPATVFWGKGPSATYILYSLINGNQHQNGQILSSWASVFLDNFDTKTTGKERGKIKKKTHSLHDTYSVLWDTVFSSMGYETEKDRFKREKKQVSKEK